MKVQNAAVNEPDAYRDLAGAQWVVDSTGTGSFVTISDFLRYLRWVTDSAVIGDPIVIIDIVAKE